MYRPRRQHAATPRLKVWGVRADAVLVTGPSAFAVAQVAIGALQFMPQLQNMTPKATLPDPAGCVTGQFTTQNMSDLLMRQLRCART